MNDQVQSKADLRASHGPGYWRKDDPKLDRKHQVKKTNIGKMTRKKPNVGTGFCMSKPVPISK